MLSKSRRSDKQPTSSSTTQLRIEILYSIFNSDKCLNSNCWVLVAQSMTQLT